jgi:acyl carrier protein
VLALVNNAGVRADGLALSLSDEDWRIVLDTNLGSTYRLTRTALRAMIRARFGRVINIASVVGPRANAGQANYAASKAAVIAFTKTAAVEVARRGVTINAVAPGLIATAMTDDIPQEFRDRVPAQRAGTPEEVAAAVAFLASDRAGYITGSHPLCRRRTVRLSFNERTPMAEHTSEQIEKVITDSLISFGANADDINRDAELTALDIDSLDLAELSQIIEEQFGVELTSGDVAEIATVGDAIDLVAERC